MIFRMVLNSQRERERERESFQKTLVFTIQMLLNTRTTNMKKTNRKSINILSYTEMYKVFMKSIKTTTHQYCTNYIHVL